MSKGILRFNHRPAARSIVVLVCLMAAGLLLAGCAPTYGTRQNGYNGGHSGRYYGSRGRCYDGCGYVQSIRQVPVGNKSGALLGTVIGAVVGGALGHQVGGGTGKTVATVAGAVAGGAAGHAIGKRTGRNDYGWQIVVQLNDGRYATVTQHQRPPVRVGDYVVIRNNEVYEY